MNGVLPSWLERFLGIEASPGQGTAWSLDTSWSWAPWVTLLFVSFAAAWVIYFYVKEGPTLGRRMRTFLIAVRLMLVGLLLFMIAEVMISLQRTGLPYVVIVVDDSASMGITDRYTDGKQRAALLERLRNAELDGLTRANLAKMLLVENDARLLRSIEKQYKLRLYFLSGAARLQDGSVDDLVQALRELEPTGESSRLGAGLRSVLSDMRGSPPAAILLLTDGVTTDGETLTEASQYARRKGVPLLTIGLGDEQPVQDVEVSDLLVDDVVFVNDIVNFETTIVSTGYDGREVEVLLKEKDGAEVLSRAKLTLAGKGERQKARLTYRPTKTGTFEYVVEVPPLPNEAQPDNNRRVRLVNVRDDQIKVLLVQAYPNFEFRYLKNMLDRDTTIELSSVLQEADVRYASGFDSFPVRRDDLFKFDVVIFGDVNPAFLSATDMANLRDFVQEKGGGIVVMCGPSYTPLAYRDTPLANLFPIDLNTARLPVEEVIDKGFSPLPTDLGMSSPNMLLGDDPAESLRIWRQLPPLYWLLEASHLKPAVRVLAEHPLRTGADGQKLPVICLQYVGAGKVLFHTTDETWRWRFRIGDVLFARYWVQSIRYLARSKLLGGDGSAELTVDHLDGVYRRGEPVRIRVRFVDERLAPAADDGVTVVIEQRGQKNRRLQLHRNANNRGIYEGAFTGASEGNYHVWMVSPSLEGKPPSADYQVSAPPGEFERVEMDINELKQAAAETRGKFYRVHEVSDLLEYLPEGRQVPVETLPPEVLWNRWWVLMVFLSLLITEWVTRKQKGLL